MQIKSSSSRPTRSRPSRRAFTLTTALIVSLLCWAIYQIGWQENQVIGFINDASTSIKSISESVWEGQSTQVQPMDLPHIEIFIKPNDLKTLYQKRQEAMSIYFLEKTSDDFVPAIIQYDGNDYDVRMRLKGDFTDHLNKHKWSFRVEVKGDNAIMGMKRFSIQHPITRSYLYEWVYFKMLRRENLIALRYDFITASLNGNSLGIYALEEHFEKRLIENNDRREGPIIRFNEDLSWWAKTNRLEEFGGEIDEAATDSFDTNKWLADPKRREVHNRALNLMESFRSGEVSTSEAFDIEQLARFYGVCEITGNEHSRVWNNLRYYYNPVTSKFEPVGFDASIGQRFKPLVIGDVRDFPNNRLFADKAFIAAYVRTLERMSKPEYLEDFFQEHGSELDRLEATLRQEWPTEPLIDRKLFWDSQAHFRKALDPFKALHVFVRDFQDGKLALQIGNIQPIPVVVTGFKWGDELVRLDDPLHVSGKYRFEPMEYQTVEFDLPVTASVADVESTLPIVTFHLLGLDETNEVEAFPWAQAPGYMGPELIARQEPNAADFDFISMNEDSRLILIAPGEHKITRDLIIPPGYTVVCGEGTILDLTKSALIFSYSPLDWSGAMDKPIAVTTSDNTGQGLVVVNPHDESRLTHVVFNNLRFPRRDGWELTGAVTFYGAKVDMLNCSFYRIHAEDGLNLVRSEFNLKSVRFEFCGSDALDADFSKGEINESYFLAPGNDAIDVSGGWVTIKSTLIQNARDKGVSSGERSVVYVYGVTVEKSEIAMACKDSSELTGDDNKIINCKVGLTAFRKKPEFGPALINLNQSQIINVEKPTLIETGAELRLNGEVSEGNLTNVEAMLYGAQYGTASNRE